MVDEMKKQMCRLEHQIGFKGTLDVTSNESMEELIKALVTKYKNDVQNSLRLHRLEFFYDLVERQKDDDVVRIEAKDIDDWKDILALSKIYYLLEHPRSEGLKWKRYITKKKTIDRFTDIDLIEWRVSQNFRLRSLMEWAQRRNDARRLARLSSYSMDDDVQECKELDEFFDQSASKHQVIEKKAETKPFKFQDECVEDWTDSYSDDSEHSDIGDLGEAIEDFSEETEQKFEEVEELLEKEESISDMLATYPEFSQYRESIFEEMDKAKTFEEWFALYDETRVQKLSKITIESHQEQPELLLEEEKQREDQDKIFTKIKEETEKEDDTDDTRDYPLKKDKIIEAEETTDEKTEETDVIEAEAVVDVSKEKLSRDDKETTNDEEGAPEHIVSVEKEATEGATDEEASDENEAEEATEEVINEKEATEGATDEKEANTTGGTINDKEATKVVTEGKEAEATGGAITETEASEGATDEAAVGEETADVSKAEEKAVDGVEAAKEKSADNDVEENQ